MPPASPRLAFAIIIAAIALSSGPHEFWFPLSHRWIDDSSHSMRPR